MSILGVSTLVSATSVNTEERNESFRLEMQKATYSSKRGSIDVDFWNRQLAAIPNLRHFRVGAFIRKGSEGAVYKLENITTGVVDRVLKVANDCDGRARYYPGQGAHLVFGINHPNICSPTHFFYANQAAFSLTPEPESLCAAMVMPHVEGDTLDYPKILEVAVRVERSVYLGLQLATGLYELSRRGIQHGDLGDNILIEVSSKDLLPKIDLGNEQWAKYFGDIGEEASLPKNIDQKFKPIIIDFSRSKKISSVSVWDYAALQSVLLELIHYSKDLKPTAKKFLLEYLNEYCNPTDPLDHPHPELDKLPQRMIALMQVCIYYLDAIKIQSAKTFVPEHFEDSILRHMDFAMKLLEAEQRTQEIIRESYTSSNSAMC